LGYRRQRQRESRGRPGRAAYLHQFVSLLTALRAVLLMGGYAEHWWLRYLRRADSPALALIVAPHPSASTRRRRPDFEREISIAMAKARQAAPLTAPARNGIHGIRERSAAITHGYSFGAAGW
jgi:hypothetical protein